MSKACREFMESEALCIATSRPASSNCNDGYGGSGSGLFDEAGRLVAMQSASLSLQSWRARRMPPSVGGSIRRTVQVSRLLSPR
jgi:hypothetical protein